MPLTQRKLDSRTWYAFILANLELVPAATGVYWLGVDNNTIYIGSTANLNERLTAHYYASNPCISKASQFAIELCSNYRERERELLQAFLNQYGRLPSCNDRIP